MRDCIIIEGLELSANVGVPDEERHTAQRLTANLHLEPTRHFADLNDEIDSAVNYLLVSRAVQKLAREGSRRLLETLANDIVTMLLGRFPLHAVQVELRKYILPDTTFVAVRLRREHPAPL